MVNQEYGKTIFISLLSKIIKNRKILILDFDLINNNLHSVFGVAKNPKEIKELMKNEELIIGLKLKHENIRKLIVKVNRNIDLISSLEIIFDEKQMWNIERIKRMLDYLKKYYDLILIDTSSDTKYIQLSKILIELSSKVVCLIEGNLMNIKKTIKLLNDTIRINTKIKIVYNKKDKYTLSNKIIKVILYKFKVIGSLNYYNSYNQIINKNVNKLWIGKNIQKEFNMIIKNL